MKTNNKLKTLTVLKHKEFNKTQAEANIKKALLKLDNDIIKVNKEAEKRGIYIRIDESNEREKILKKLFPFLYNSNQKVNLYDIKETVQNVNYEYNRRIQKALYNIGFVSIDEKNKVIKCKKKYSFGNLNLYHLNHIAEWQTNLNNTGKDSDSVAVLRTYQNLNVEFKFKSDIDFETFKTLVYYSNPETIFLINNAPKELITEYKAKKKEKYYNEIQILHKWTKENFKDFSYSVPINKDLVNKCWGC